MKTPLKVLAVGDPAVYAYTAGSPSLVEQWAGPVEFDILPWAEYYPALMKALAAEQAEYDIVMVAGHLWLADFVSKGWLAEIGGLPAAYKVDDILQSVREEMCYQERQYLLPSFSDGHIIYYQRELVQSVLGRELPEVVTVGEFLEAVRQCADNPAGVPPLALKAHSAEIFLDWLPYLRHCGGRVLTEELQPALNSPEGLQALELYRELKGLCPAGTEEFGNEEIMRVIQNGEAVFAVSWGGQAGSIVDPAKIDPAKLGYATFAEPWNVTWSFGVAARSVRKAEAIDFLAYLTGSSVDRVIGHKAGSPCRYSSYRHDALECPWFGAQQELLRRAKPLPSFPGSGEVYGVIYGNIHAAFTGKRTPAEALELSEKQIRLLRK
jgi:multiple sugar transport system substrate-binding protein